MIQYLLETTIELAVVFILCGFLTYFFSGHSKIAASGKEILETGMLIVLVYFVFSMVYASGSDYEGIPFAGLINGNGSLQNLWKNHPEEYLSNVAELVMVTFICGLLSNWFPASKVAGSNRIARILYYIAIILAGLALNHYVITYAKDNNFFQSFLQIVQGFITAGVAALTPAMIIVQIVARLTGLDENSPWVKLMADQLPASGLGKAIKSAFSSSIIFLCYLHVIEKHMGSLLETAGTVGYLIEMVAVMTIMITGIVLMLSAILK